MSQTPWPYPQQYPYPPQAYVAPAYDPYRAMLAPARRAAVFVIIMASLLLICGGGVGAMGLLVPEQMIHEALAATPRANVPIEAMRVGFAVLGCAGLLIGGVLLMTGVFIWRGSGAAVVVGIVLTVIALIGAFLNTAAGISQLGHLNGPAELAGGACSLIVMPALLLVMFAFLIQARRAVRTYQQTVSQYQALYWQYQQQQQMYRQSSYTPPTQPPMA